MTALPNVMVPLFDRGRATEVLRDLLSELSDNLPASDVELVDANGLATQPFRTFLRDIDGIIVPAVGVRLADREGRATPVFHRLLWEATR